MEGLIVVLFCILFLRACIEREEHCDTYFPPMYEEEEDEVAELAEGE